MKSSPEPTGQGQNPMGKPPDRELQKRQVSPDRIREEKLESELILSKELGPEGYKLRQQNIQLRYSLKYKDEVEIPTLLRQIEQSRGEKNTLSKRLREGSKQDEFLDTQLGIVHLDSENRIIKINSCALQVLGNVPSEVLGRPITEAGFHLVSGKSIFSDIDYHLEPEGKESEWEREITLPKGEKRYYQFRSMLISGTRIISILDRTAYRISESRVKAIIGSSKDGILVVDGEDVIRFTNNRFGKLFGINWRQFGNMRFGIAVDLLQFHFDDNVSFLEFCHSIEKDPDKHAESIFDIALPRKATFQIYTRPIFDENNRIIGRVWFVTDVSKFKELERNLEDKVRERTEKLEIQNQELVQVKQNLEKAKMEMEMELDMAKQVQEGLLPKGQHHLPGYEVAATYVPTGKVGGDFYEIARLDENRVFLLMADVSGHGVPAALVTAMAKMAFDRHAKANLTLPEVLSQVNLDLCAAVKTDHYLTAFAAILELNSGKLTYSRVCHPYPVLYRHQTGTLDHLQMRGGFFLGMFEQNNFSSEELYLQPGDLLFVFTDGINESFNQNDEQYGRERLDAVISKYASQGAHQVVSQAQIDKEKFAGGRASLDDITIFSLRRLMPEGG